MKSITIGSQKISILPNKIEVDIQPLKKNIKIVDATLNPKVSSSSASSFKVYYTNDVGTAGEKWGIVDLVKITGETKDITLNISDELQDALENGAKKATFTFQDENNGSITFSSECDLKIDYISLSEYRKNGTNHKVNLGKTGEATIDLSTGVLSLNTPLVSSDNNVLPLSINAHYNSAQSSKIPSDTGMPKNWGLNVQQFLIRNDDTDKLSFTYIDENGQEQLIEEKYYYLDDKGDKVSVPLEELTVDLDGNRKFEGKEIFTQLESTSGLKLVSSIKDIKGHELVDYEPDELIKIKEKLNQYEEGLQDVENEIKNDRKQLSIYAVSRYTLLQQLKNTEDSIPINKEYLDLMVKIEKLRNTQFKDNRSFIGTRTSTMTASEKNGPDYTTIKTSAFKSDAAERYLTDKDISKEKLTKIVDFYSEYPPDILGDLNGIASEPDMSVVRDIIVNESSEIYNFGINHDETTGGSLKLQLDSSALNEKIYCTDFDSDFFNNILKEIPQLSDLNESEQQKLLNELGLTDYFETFISQYGYYKEEGMKWHLSSKDIISCDLQLGALVEQIKKLNDKQQNYKNEISKLIHQQNLLEMQVPVHYLYDENNVIYGFGKVKKQKENSENLIDNENLFRLVLITDAYENAIYISYESPTSNRIESIQDSTEKTILFKYNENKDNNQLVIKDSRDRSVILEYKDSLTKITHLDKTSSYLYYNSDNELVATLNDSGVGARFTYDCDKVTKIDLLSILDRIEDGKLFYDGNKESFDFENFKPSNCDDFVIEKGSTSISYNNINSTTLSTPSTSNRSKHETYIFDKSGNVRTIYSLPKDYSVEEENNCVTVNDFNYQNNLISTKTSILPYSKNYLENVCSGEGTKVKKDALYVGDCFCGNNTYSYQYEVCQNYHTYPSENTKSSVEIDPTLFTLLTNGETEDELNPVCKHRSYVVSGWAKANSAFIIPDNLTEDEIGNYADYIKNRKFEIRVEVSYVGDQEPTQFKKSFDWRNMEWQYCAVPVSIDPNKQIQKIECFVDYSGNTGTMYFTDLEFKEGNWESVKYDTQDRPIEKETAHSDWIVSYEYEEDSASPAKEIISSKMNADQTPFITTYEYTKQGRLLRSVDYNGVVKENVYNDKGQVVETITYHKDEPANKFYDIKILDDKGNTTSEVNEFGEEIAKYDYIEGTGIVSTQTDENGVKTSNGYSPDDTLLETTTTINGIDNTNTFGYTLGYLTSLKHNDFEIAYDYDKQGRTTKIRIADNEYLSKEYSDEEETTILKTGEIYRQTFDENGNVLDTFYKSSETAQEEHISQNIYDSYGNLVFTKEYPDQENPHVIKYSINKFGQTYKEETTQNDKVVTITNLYDDNHEKVESSIIEIENLTSEERPLVYCYNYTNTPDAKLESISLPNEFDQFIYYDKLGRLDKIDLGFNTKKFTYLKSGDHASNLVSKVEFAKNGLIRDNLKYSYDKKGNITEIRQSNDLIARYQYDGLSRIVREDNSILKKTITFTYDAGGNITERREYTFTVSQNLDFETCTTIPYIYPISGWRDQLMEYNGEKFEYDAIGNPIKYRDKTLVWSHGRQLDKFGDIATFTYDINGLRTSKYANGFTTKYYLNGNKIVAQEDAINKMYFFYGADGVTGFELNGVSYFYKKNVQNDVIGIYNGSGDQIVEYIYDAWGNFSCRYLSNNGTWLDIDRTMSYTNVDETNRFISLINPFRYRSYYYDYETNLYYLNSRYYDPEIGRFINADDVSTLDITKVSSNGVNLYAYCLNNPVNEIDENGFFGLLALLGIFIASFVIGGGIQLVGNAMAGKTGSELWRGVVGAAFGAAFNSLMLCFTMPLGVASIFISAGIGSLIQSGVDLIETAIRHETIDWSQTGINLGINFASSLIGNYLGGKLIPTNTGWFQPQKFMSIFTKPYGQKLLLQTLFGSLLSVLIGWIRGEEPKKHYNYDNLNFYGG